MGKVKAKLYEVSLLGEKEKLVNTFKVSNDILPVKRWLESHLKDRKIEWVELWIYELSEEKGTCFIYGGDTYFVLK